MLSMHIDVPARRELAEPLLRGRVGRIVAGAFRQTRCNVPTLCGNLLHLGQPEVGPLDQDAREKQASLAVPVDGYLHVQGQIFLSLFPKQNTQRGDRCERGKCLGPMLYQPCDDPLHSTSPVLCDSDTVAASAGGVVPSPVPALPAESSPFQGVI